MLISSKGKEKYYQLDPTFPNLLFNTGFAAMLRLLQSLLADHSTRWLSEPNDRAVALSGLAIRIAGALGCQERYGIHRSILWRRSGEPMTRILYDSGEGPLWSWMAHTGVWDYKHRQKTFTRLWIGIVVNFLVQGCILLSGPACFPQPPGRLGKKRSLTVLAYSFLGVLLKTSCSDLQDYLDDNLPHRGPTQVVKTMSQRHGSFYMIRRQNIRVELLSSCRS